MKLKIIHFITLLLITLVIGVFWGTWLSMTRSIETFSADEFIHIGKTIMLNVAWPMRIIMPLCILMMIFSLWLDPQKKSVPFYFGLTAFILLIITLLITVGIEVPIDNQIRKWTTATIPDNWEMIRERWKVFHAIRTFISLISFACFLVTVLFNNTRVKQ